MQGHILAVLGVITISLLINCVSCSNVTFNINDDVEQSVDLHRSPFKSDLAYQFYKHAFDFIRINAETADTNRDYNEDQCFQDITKIKEGLDRYEEWALHFPDTWGRLPIGLWWGHPISMGQYEECLEIARQFSDTEELHGQYCLASINITNFMKDVIPNNGGASSMRAISYKKKESQIFELGVCVPSSCHPKTTDFILKHVISSYYNTSKLDMNATMIRENWCDYEKPKQLRGIDIFAIVFFSLITFIMIVSSIYDYVQTKNEAPKKPLFTAFSVLTNAPRIFTVKKVNSPNVIHCLSGLRVFSMMWVILGHGYMAIYDLPHINKNKIYNWIETPYSMLIQNSTLCVDTFFFMSGLLMCWGAFREMERTKGKLNLGLMYFHRYIRLTPVVAVVILYIMSLYKYSGAGPMWFKLGTQDNRCSNTWWATLLYVQNYVYPYQICMSQSWYLAVDTQLYFLSPLFLIPLWKWGKKALGPIFILFLLCLGCTFATFIHNEFTLFRVQDNHVDDRQRYTYYPTHTRIPTWLMGVVFGYFLFTKNRGRQIPLAKGWVILGWILAFGIMLTDLWGPYWRIRPENPDSPLIEGALYEPLSRTSWAAAIGWIIWACYNGHGGLVNDFLSWSFFTGFSRLTYCMYVIHRIVQNVHAGRTQTDTHFSDYDAILRWWDDFGISLTLSIYATLAFEAPILGIEKAIFGKKSSSVPKKLIDKPPTPTDPVNVTPAVCAEPETGLTVIPTKLQSEEPSKV